MNNKYEGNDNYGKPKSGYLEKLQKMTDEQLKKETETMIWLSAYASNNRRSDYHWQCDATYDEWKNRNNEDGYKKAYDYIMRSL